MFCNQALSAGLLGHIEALYGTKDQDDLKNDLCRPGPPSHDLVSFLQGYGKQRRDIVNCGKNVRIKDFLFQSRPFLHGDDEEEDDDAISMLSEPMGPMETAATAEDIKHILKNGLHSGRRFAKARHAQIVVSQTQNSQMGKVEASISKI